MTDNIVNFGGVTTLDLPPNRVLSAAILDPPLDTVLIIGKAQDGGLYLAGSTSHMGEISLLIRRAEAHIVRLIEEQFP